MDVKEFDRLKNRVAQLQTEKARSEGVLAEKMKTLKGQFGCSTLKEAREKKRELEAEIEKLEAAWDRDYQKFKDQWDEYIRG